MMDERRLYISQLLRNYKQGNLFDSSMKDRLENVYSVRYQLYDKGQQYKLFSHNEGIEFVIEYIRELENKIDELEYVERIIKLAKIE